MKKKIIICISILLAVALLVSGSIITINKVQKNEVDISSHLSAFSDTSKMSYSVLFYELSEDEKNETDTWRQGNLRKRQDGAYGGRKVCNTSELFSRKQS